MFQRVVNKYNSDTGGLRRYQATFLVADVLLFDSHVEQRVRVPSGQLSLLKNRNFDDLSCGHYTVIYGCLPYEYW